MSGHIIGRDPLIDGNRVTLATDVAPGSYSVSLVHLLQDVADDICAIGVHLLTTTPVRWDHSSNAVLVDSASIALMDGAATVEVNKDTVIASWEWHQTADRTNGILVGIGSDGGYGCYQGIDAEGRCCCVAILIAHLANWSPWPIVEPPLPHGLTPAFFDWLRTQRHLQAYPDVWLDNLPVSAEGIARLERENGQVIPVDILSLYHIASPWSTDLETWWSTTRQRFSERLDASKLLPLQEETVAVLTQGGAFTIHEWFDSTYGPTTFNYRCRLRGYLLLKFLEGFNHNPL